MEKIIYVLLCLVCLGCSTTAMVETTYTSTGQLKSTTYSKYYDDGQWIIPNKLGMQIVMDHVKKQVPIIHGFKTSLGALGPDDFDAQGEITIYLMNYSKEPLNILIKKIQCTSCDSEISYEKKENLYLPIGSRLPWEAGTIDIYNYSKEVGMEVFYVMNAQNYSKSFLLKRRTNEELVKYFGPNGKPPYPWIK